MHFFNAVGQWRDDSHNTTSSGALERGVVAVIVSREGALRTSHFTERARGDEEDSHLSLLDKRKKIDASMLRRSIDGLILIIYLKHHVNEAESRAS